MKSCIDPPCRHAVKSLGNWLCRAQHSVIPTMTMRDIRNACGPEGQLWEPLSNLGRATPEDFEHGLD